MKSLPAALPPCGALGLLFCLPFFAGFLRPANLYGVLIKADTPAFNLSNQQSNPFDNKDLTGKYVVLFFGFTRCAATCPGSLGLLRNLAEANPEADLRFVMVSIDPQRDQPADLRRYTHAQDPRFAALSGSTNQIRRLALAFSESFSPTVPQTGALEVPVINHSGRLYLIDATGKRRLVYTASQKDLEKISADLRYLRRTAPARDKPGSTPRAAGV